MQAPVASSGYSTSNHDLLSSNNHDDNEEEEEEDSAFPLALRPDVLTTFHMEKEEEVGKGVNPTELPQVQRSKLRLVETLGEGKFGMVSG